LGGQGWLTWFGRSTALCCDGSEVEGDGGEIEVECVRLKASVAHSDEAVAAFEHGESALDGASDAADQFVAHALPVWQLLLAAGPSMLDTVLGAARLQSRAPGPCFS
jgi:hypothetical protein